MFLFENRQSCRLYSEIVPKQDQPAVKMADGQSFRCSLNSIKNSPAGTISRENPGGKAISRTNPGQNAISRTKPRTAIPDGKRPGKFSRTNMAVKFSNQNPRRFESRFRQPVSTTMLPHSENYKSTKIHKKINGLG
jgi:hypothetical protein